MKVIYSQPNCPACDRLKERYKREGVEFKEKILHVDIPIDEFIAKFPGVRTVPFEVEE